MPEQYPWLLLNSLYESVGIQVCFVLSVMADSLLVYFSKDCIIVVSLAKPYLPYIVSLAKSYLPYSKKFYFIKFLGTNLNTVIFSMFNWKSYKLYICHGFSKTETQKNSYFFNLSFPLLEKDIKQTYFGIHFFY